MMIKILLLILNITIIEKGVYYDTNKFIITNKKFISMNIVIILLVILLDNLFFYFLLSLIMSILITIILLITNLAYPRLYNFYKKIVSIIILRIND